MIIMHFKSTVFLFLVMCILPGIIKADEIKGAKIPGDVSNKLLVRFYSEVTEEKKAALRKEVGADLLKRLNKISAEVWKLPDGLSVDDAIEKLNREPSVEFTGPDYIYKPHSLPNDSKFDRQWYLNNRVGVYVLFKRTSRGGKLSGTGRSRI